MRQIDQVLRQARFAEDLAEPLDVLARALEPRAEEVALAIRVVVHPEQHPIVDHDRVIEGWCRHLDERPLLGQPLLVDVDRNLAELIVRRLGDFLSGQRLLGGLFLRGRFLGLLERVLDRRSLGRVRGCGFARRSGPLVGRGRRLVLRRDLACGDIGRNGLHGRTLRARASDEAQGRGEAESRCHIDTPRSPTHLS